MSEAIKIILGWSEVWALLIPLAVLFYKKKQPTYLKYVIVYVCVAFFINLFQDTIANLKVVLHFPYWLQTNNYVYNLHSILRLLLFSTFFINLKQPFLSLVKKLIPFAFLLFVLINFTFFENFFNYYLLSSRLLSLEAACLLFYCLQYYLYKLQDENEVGKKQPDFWVVTGLTIFVCVSFFIFLFQNTLVKQLKDTAVSIWKIHDVAYIILCIFIAKAFYGSRRK